MLIINCTYLPTYEVCITLGYPPTSLPGYPPTYQHANLCYLATTTNQPIYIYMYVYISIYQPTDTLMPSYIATSIHIYI